MTDTNNTVLTDQPTTAMLVAAELFHRTEYVYDEFRPLKLYAGIYHAMRAAAPRTQPPASEADPVIRNSLITASEAGAVPVDAIMTKVQEFASTWAIVDSRFDDGTAMERAEASKAEIRAILEAAPPSAPAAEPARTDAQIVAQTEELARLLMSEMYQREASTAIEFRNADDPRGSHCWLLACRIQELLTDTDPENSVAEVEAAPAAESAELAALPDPYGCNKCQHPDCGRFNGPRHVECRAMADNACAREYAVSTAATADAQPDDFIGSVKRLCIAARTTGGTAGHDADLCRALDRVEGMLQAIDDPDWQAQANQRSVNAQPPYPEGEIVGSCVCGSWPGGHCLKCRWTPATADAQLSGNPGELTQQPSGNPGELDAQGDERAVAEHLYFMFDDDVNLTAWEYYWEGWQKARAALSRQPSSPTAQQISDYLNGLDSIRRGVVEREAQAIQPSAAASEKPTPAGRDVLAERRRQVEVEGWTPEHDDAHTNGSMCMAAVCYAEWGHYELPNDGEKRIPVNWPWAFSWWKPSDHRRNLVKAGALLLAEIERLDRAALAAAKPEGGSHGQ